MSARGWQGTETRQRQTKQPELWRLWREDPDALRIPGGESLADVRERAHRRAVELVEEHRGSRIAVVSHRSVAKLLGGALLGLTAGYFWKFYLDNAAYSVFAHSDNDIGHSDTGFVLLKWNEACHLRERVVERY